MHDSNRFREFRDLTLFFINENKTPLHFAEGLIARNVVDGFMVIHVGSKRFLFNANTVREIMLEVGLEEERFIYPGMPI